jgi:tRNA-2-methylthio-N6-dimethylallyladenosine synthase
LVHFSPPRSGSALRAGVYASVAITGAAPHHLTGELVDVLAQPTHRVRIPVLAVEPGVAAGPPAGAVPAGHV